MKHLTCYQASRLRSGLTLIEMTVVILVLLSLTGAFFASSASIGEWQKGKEAASILRDVEVAQREFLANNPQRAVSSLTAAEVASYLPSQTSVLPADAALPNDVVDLDGNALGFNVTVSPPFFTRSGVRYDPSDTTEDSLWDVGK